MKAIQETLSSIIDGQFSLEKYTAGPPAVVEASIWDEFEGIDDMEGIEPRLPKIDIAHSVQLFQLPDGTTTPTITGIIIDHFRCNDYWETPLSETEGGQPPDCFSLGAYKPHPNSRVIQAPKCLECPRGQYKGGCKKSRRLHIMLEGSVLPHKLSVSLMSLKGFDEFVTLQVTQRKLKLIGVMVKIGLEAAKSSGGIKYSRLTFSLVTDSEGQPIVLAKTRDQAASLAALRAQWLDTMRGEDIFEEHTAPAGEAYDVMKYSSASTSSSAPKNAKKGDEAPMFPEEIEASRESVVEAFGADSAALKAFDEAVKAEAWDTARDYVNRAVAA